MLGFTFGILSERYDAKRALVREEALPFAPPGSDRISFRKRIAPRLRPCCCSMSLDRPDSGVIKVSQQPLIDLHDSIAAAAARAQRE